MLEKSDALLTRYGTEPVAVKLDVKGKILFPDGGRALRAELEGHLAVRILFEPEPLGRSQASVPGGEGGSSLGDETKPDRKPPHRHAHETRLLVRGPDIGPFRGALFADKPDDGLVPLRRSGRAQDLVPQDAAVPFLDRPGDFQPTLSYPINGDAPAVRFN